MFRLACAEEEEFWNELGRALEDCPEYALTPRSASPCGEDFWSYNHSEEEDSSAADDSDDDDVYEEKRQQPEAKRSRYQQPDPLRKSSSTYRGVSLCAKDSRWQARIRVKKEVVYLGRFETEELAARRYDEAAREHHGGKALINFITEEDRNEGRKSVFEQAGGKSARV